MPTGACGINCDMCRLHLLGVCSSCGSGRSKEGAEKAAVQLRLFGASCRVLACATKRQVAYCMRDCEGFPCEMFRTGQYPFSEGFLSMQERRRRDLTSNRSPSGDVVKVPPQYWEELAGRPLKEICGAADASLHPQAGIVMPFLNEWLLIDPAGRSLFRERKGLWERIEDQMLILLTLVYLLGADKRALSNRPVSVKQLRCANFFKGPHELNLAPLEKRFGEDPDGFKKAAEVLGGTPVPMADAAYVLKVFPKVPLYVLLWTQDDEFEARVSVLFDQSVEAHLAPDAIWGMVNLVSRYLLMAVPGGQGITH